MLGEIENDVLGRGRLTHALVILTRFLHYRVTGIGTVAGYKCRRVEKKKRNRPDIKWGAENQSQPCEQRSPNHSHNERWVDSHARDNRHHFLPPRYGLQCTPKHCAKRAARGEKRWQRRRTKSSQEALRRSRLKEPPGTGQQLICQRSSPRHELNGGRLSQFLRQY